MRGSQGGYKLSKSPDQITIMDILVGIEGKVKLLDYTKNDTVLQVYWKEVELKFQKLFNSTIENLIQEDKKIRNKLSFQI